MPGKFIKEEQNVGAHVLRAGTLLSGDQMGGRSPIGVRRMVQGQRTSWRGPAENLWGAKRDPGSSRPAMSSMRGGMPVSSLPKNESDGRSASSTRPSRPTNRSAAVQDLDEVMFRMKDLKQTKTWGPTLSGILLICSLWTASRGR